MAKRKHPTGAVREAAVAALESFGGTMVATTSAAAVAVSDLQPAAGATTTAERTDDAATTTPPRRRHRPTSTTTTTDDDDDGRLPLEVLAQQRWTPTRDRTGRLFLIRTDSAGGTPVAVPLSAPDLAADLAHLWHADTGKLATDSRCRQVVQLMRGTARAALRPVETVTRYGRDAAGRRIVDLGADGADDAVVVMADGRAWLERATPAGADDPAPTVVRVRNPDISRPMPTPDLSATLDDLDDLRRLVNVTDADWPLLLGWIVCAVIGAETPVLHLSGEAGTGKSTAATALVALLDPAHAVQRAAPVDDRDWSTQCASSAVLLLDNLDSFPAWLSNALCRTVTGAGYVTRRLYSDAGLTALAYRRAVVVTSIAAAPTRGDLADRMLTVELDRIAQRAPAGRMAERLRTAAPRIMGAVVKLAAVVAADLDDGRSVPNSPRLVEFSAVLAALDDLGGPWGTGALATFRRRSADGLAATADGHPVAIALRAMLHGRPAGWTGSASELLAELRRYRPPDDDPTVNRRVPWPTDATRLAGALRLLGPALEAAGVPIRNSRTATRRTYSIGTPVADDLDDLDDAMPVADDLDDLDDGTPVAPATLLDDLDDATPVAGDAGWIDDATTDDATTDDATPPPDDLDDATPVADDLDDLDAAGGRWDDPVAAPDDDPFGGL